MKSHFGFVSNHSLSWNLCVFGYVRCGCACAGDCSIRKKPWASNHTYRNNTLLIKHFNVDATKQLEQISSTNLLTVFHAMMADNERKESKPPSTYYSQHHHQQQQRWLRRRQALLPSPQRAIISAICVSDCVYFR